MDKMIKSRTTLDFEFSPTNISTKMVNLMIAGLILAISVANCEVPFPYRDLCPCLPLKLCPRVYGASVEDRKYLGEFLKCKNEGEVRCCGAMTSVEVNPIEKKKTDSEIEDVQMFHFLSMTTEEPEVEEETTTLEPEILEDLTTTTTEFPTETTTILETTEEPPETTTYVDRKPKFGDNVEFIYAMDEKEMMEENRKGKVIEEPKEEVHIIMPNLESLLNFENVLTTTETPEETTTEIIPSSSSSTSTSTEKPTPTTSRRFKLKVRKNYLEHMREKLHHNEENDQEDFTSTEKLAKRINRMPENSLFYKRRKALSVSRTLPITTTSTTTTLAPETTTIKITTPHPARKLLLNSDLSKRKNYFNSRRFNQPAPPVEKTISPRIDVINLHFNDTLKEKIDSKHQDMIKQVVRAIRQDSMMSTFDVADELMSDEMAKKIGKLQSMLAEKIMEKVQGKVGVRANLETEEGQMEMITKTPLKVVPYRGSKRYIDTNFLSVYQNVIDNVEKKIHDKNKLKKPTTLRPKEEVSTTESNVQILIPRFPNRRRITRPDIKSKSKTESQQIKAANFKFVKTGRNLKVPKIESTTEPIVDITTTEVDGLLEIETTTSI